MVCNLRCCSAQVCTVICVTHRRAILFFTVDRTSTTYAISGSKYSMSLSQAGDKENLRVPTITIPPQKSQARADWVPQQHLLLPLTRRLHGRQQMIKPFGMLAAAAGSRPPVTVTRCDKQIKRLLLMFALLEIRQPSTCDLKPRLRSGPLVTLCLSVFPFPFTHVV